MFLFFLFFPIIEILSWYLFIQKYSFFDAVLLMFFGGGLGLLIIRTQGQSALQSLQMAFADRRLPENFIFHRILILFGGFLILIPGIFSKIVGTIFILPGFRHLIVLYLKWYFLGKIAKGQFRVFAMGGFPFGKGTGADGFHQQTTTHQTAERDVVEITPNKIEHRDSSNADS